MTETRKVYIVGGSQGMYSRMFTMRGWQVTDNKIEADLAQFTGGADVSPWLYGEKKHPRTGNTPDRDKFEKHEYNQLQELGVPCAGICRGGQFLNVMNEGKMYQDVNNHAIGGMHIAYLIGNLVPVYVTSTHHQMMRPSEDGLVVMTAGLSTYKEWMEDEHIVRRVIHKPEVNKEDIEAVYYEDTASFCFQPHPEFNNNALQDLYFNLLDEYLFGETVDIDITNVDGSIIVTGSLDCEC